MVSQLELIKDKAGVGLGLVGPLDLYHASAARKLLQKAKKEQTVDMSGVTKLDTVGALLLRQLTEKKHIRLAGLKPEHEAILALVSKSDISLPPRARRVKPVRAAIIGLGKRTIDSALAIREFVAFLGQVVVTLSRSFSSLKHLRIADIMHQIEQTGILAIPIISTMAFMIAVVLTYQGVAQLRPLGAEHLTVNLVAISMLREMGVLLTAIMVAGRSGSAFTAQIGVMKVREEVDALQTTGMDPFEVLVMPRLLALLISLPLLTFIADAMGILGGGLMSRILIDLPLDVYFERVRVVAKEKDFLVGMIKAPVFAFIISMVGCLHGMRVAGSADSVGRETTASVVKAIFLVLAADAIFSIIFQKVGL